MDQQWTRTPKVPYSLSTLQYHLLAQHHSWLSGSWVPLSPDTANYSVYKTQVSCRACGPHRSTHTCFHWPSAAYAQLLPPSINVSTMWLAVRSTGLAYPYGYSTLIFEQACKTNLGSQGSILDHGDGYPSPAASFYSVQQHNATLVPARPARLCN